MSGWGSGGGWADEGSGNPEPASAGAWGSSSGGGWNVSSSENHRPSGGWDSGDSSTVPNGISSPPLVWLFAAFGVVVVSAILWVLNDSIPLGVVGWLLAGPLAVGLWAMFLIQDNRRRVAAWYAPSSLTVPLRVALLFLAFAMVALHAYHVADQLSRGGST